ncbi:NlpC-P60 family protein [Xanthomonas maliensis]|nr:SH3 domain-containing protein [Xanthomonas maliensis]KAB7768086.1 NlpC-P60 family protein [Xanthomonas maliensis]
MPARPLRLLLLSLVLWIGAAEQAAAATPDTPPVFALQPTQLQADSWIARAPAAQQVRLQADQIAAFNARLLQEDASMQALDALPQQLPGAQVRARIQTRSATPTRALYDDDGRALGSDRLAALQQALALDAIPTGVQPAYALVVRRAALRRFPTTQRVFTRPGERDIDRFQESALYPGTPVAILHHSADGAWAFVQSANYAAWIASDQLAVGTRAQVLDYAQRTPRLVVTGARVSSVYTPEQADVSALTLDMGTALPWLRDWPAQQPVNGQLPLAAYVVQLPRRAADGRLQLVPALIPRAADVQPGPLPASDAALLRQAFKFLGERYGWGNDYDARDCSGFVLDVYRSLGIALPRNTGDQARSPLLQRLPFDAQAPRSQRLRQLAQLQVGDLVHIPGHVMLVIGQQDGAPWVIHDTAGASYRTADGHVQRAAWNGVVVTPLLALLGDDGRPFVDRITSLQRILPTTSTPMSPSP